jgi:predicted DNA-binding transcriptional regulator YafY
LLIKEYNNGWYTGWYLLFQEISAGETKISLDKLRLFALDRIETLRFSSATTKIRIHPSFQPSEFFKHTLGLFRGAQEAEKIILRINADSWIKEYLPKYPIHPSQKKINAQLFELTLEINQDVENFLLRYATELQVIEPVYLRNRLLENLQKALLHYQ